MVCRRPPATIGVAINVFIAEADAGLLRNALPSGVALYDPDIARLGDDGQVRAWWGDTPVDIFLNSTPVHESAAARTRWERLARFRLPFLSCLDTAIFKAFFNRTKDRSDIEEMRKAGRLDFGAVREVLVASLGEGDERVQALDRLAETGRAFRR